MQNLLICWSATTICFYYLCIRLDFFPLALGDSFTLVKYRTVKCRMQNLDEDRRKQTILCKTHQTKISKLLHSQVVIQDVLRLLGTVKKRIAWACPDISPSHVPTFR